MDFTLMHLCEARVLVVVSYIPVFLERELCVTSEA